MPSETSSRGVRARPRSKLASQIVAPRTPSEEEIRQRAYEIYLARGTTLGNPDWDWQQAELELRARLALLGQP
jgi:hypothetical protein